MELMNNNMLFTPDKVKSRMRFLWVETSMWVRELIDSSVDRTENTQVILNEIIQNINEITYIIRYFYGNQIANRIEALLKEFFQQFSDYVVSVVNHDTERVADYERITAANTENLVLNLSKINPEMDSKELTALFQQLAVLTKQAITYKMENNTKEYIETFDKIKEINIKIADIIADGINKKFFYRASRCML